MRLSQKEADILACVELQPDVSIEDVQRQTGYSAHVVRYAIHRLEREGVIRRLTFIDMFSLGYEDYGLYFSLASLEREQQTKLLEELTRSKQVTWLIELGGEFQYCAAVYAKNVFEFHAFIQEISSRFPTLFVQKSFSARIRLIRFNHRSLSPQSSPMRVETPVPHTKSVIDSVDERILQTMNDHPTYSQRELASKLGIAFSTFHQRVKRLEAESILRGAIYAVDPMRIGMSAFQLLVYGKGISTTFKAKMEQFAEQAKQVVYFVECIGEWDFEVGVEVPRPEDVRSVVQQLYEQLGQELITVKVLSVFQNRKMRFYH